MHVATRSEERPGELLGLRVIYDFDDYIELTGWSSSRHSLHQSRFCVQVYTKKLTSRNWSKPVTHAFSNIQHLEIQDAIHPSWKASSISTMSPLLFKVHNTVRTLEYTGDSITTVLQHRRDAPLFPHLNNLLLLPGGRKRCRNIMHQQDGACCSPNSKKQVAKLVVLLKRRAELGCPLNTLTFRDDRLTSDERVQLSAIVPQLNIPPWDGQDERYEWKV